MKKTVALVAILIAIAFIGTAMASAPGKTVVFESKMGNVTFDGKTHADAGLKCTDCHPKTFQMKKGTFKMAVPHKLGENCGACHDGTKGFSQVDAAKCGECHKK